jgi:hypothetical protein
MKELDAGLRDRQVLSGLISKEVDLSTKKAEDRILAELQLVKQAILFDVREDSDHPRDTLRSEVQQAIGANGVLGERLIGGCEIQRSQCDVFQVVLTAGAASCFASGLNSGKQQSHQDANDGDHHEEFHKRESPTT